MNQRVAVYLDLSARYLDTWHLERTTGSLVVELASLSVRVQEAWTALSSEEQTGVLRVFANHQPGCPEWLPVL